MPHARACSLAVRVGASPGALLLLACYGGAAGPETLSAASTTGVGPSADDPSGMSLGTDETSGASSPTSSGGVTGEHPTTGPGAGTSAGPDATTGALGSSGASGDTSSTTTTGGDDTTTGVGPSCGELAAMLGWGDDALCEQNGDGICEGTGEPTWDCERCCDASGLVKAGFGYPVGDLTSFPAGGWSIGQVMAHYLDSYGGRHLAHDVSHPDGGVATIDAPVFAVADGVVRYAGPNASQYKHVVLIEHPVDGEESVCSFYGHINAPVVTTGQQVTRGQQITSVMDWNLIAGGSGNTHLHYGILRKSLCDASAAAKGALICGYDEGGPSGVVDLDSEPASYQPVADICGDSNHGDVFLSPTKFIEAHHY